MNQPTPAIVPQSAVRRLPRLALLLFCAAFVLPGLLGRDAWRSADVTALGFMAELAQGSASWLLPTLVGSPPENPALLPYWLGAWALQASPDWMASGLAVRLAFVAVLVLVLLATWYGAYSLARDPSAQPVAFAFGGEAHPKDYARAIADGGLLALIACLGLAQLAHETTPALAQLACSALMLYGFAALPYRAAGGLLAALAGLAGLGLSGAPAMACLMYAGASLLHLLQHGTSDSAPPSTLHNAGPAATGLRIRPVAGLVPGLLAAAALFSGLHLWQWKLEWPEASWAELRGYLELLLWFTWPVGPLALWTVWVWRLQLRQLRHNRHLALPLWWVLVTLAATLTSRAPDRALLLGLPALAVLASFALPTLKRQMASLIDWFTLLFFSFCGFTIWVVWLAMQTGFPPQPAANVQRLAPGFEPHFSAVALMLALAATLAWAWLVHWRVGRHRTALWKSLVLPAGGAAWCWLLLMSLWMPLLNYTQSYSALVRRTAAQLDPLGCVEVLHVGQAKLAALQFYGRLSLRPYDAASGSCPWLLAEPQADMAPPPALDPTHWTLQAVVQHPADSNENLLVMRRR